MEKNRLAGIDGLKGIAILAVIFTHIPLDIWLKFVPLSFQWIVSWMVSTGGVGVTIFFLTTGFLMGLLYPAPSSAISFYSRRYSRLFPPFLVMLSSFTLFKLFSLSAYEKVLIVLGCIAIVYLLVKIFSRISISVGGGKGLIYSVLALQLLVAAWYVFYLLRIPAPIFYMKWSPELQTLVTCIINATLTLPFGNYIGQLDGIYWALCAEVAFYLLYPIFIAPLISHIQKKMSRGIIILLFLALLSFCYGLIFISQRILGFGMLQIHLILYFIVGVFIGMKFTQIKHAISRFHNLLNHPIWIMGITILTFSSVPLAGYLSKYYQNWLSLGMVIPAGILLVTALSVLEKGKNILKFPFFTMMGKYSYALFLTHSFVIHTVQSYIQPSTNFDAVTIVIFSIVGSYILAFLLHHFTERPYFISRQKTPKSTFNVYTYSPKLIRIRTIALACSVFLIIYIAYRPPLSFFTYAYRQGSSSVISVFPEKTIMLTDKPVRYSFDAKQNMMGMVTSHVRKVRTEGIEGGFVPFKLYIRLLDENQNLISQSTYNAFEIIDDRYLPFGFPIETESKGKKYTVEYQLSEMSLSENMYLVTSEADLLSVYFIDKKILLKNPQVGGEWLVHKLGEPFENPMYWYTALYVLPVLLVFAVGEQVYRRIRLANIPKSTTMKV